jgi:carbonic anhydrase
MFNWGFGPAYTINHEGEDFKTLPALNFDNRTVYLSGWHIHMPSEHMVDGVRSKAEMHFVHVDERGEPASVVGIRIDVTTKTEHKSAFIEELPMLIGFNDTTVVEGVMSSPMKAIEEAGGVREYWTYQGSLTTPPCSEGLRWYIPAQPLWVNKEQMVKMLDSGKFSHRVEQVVWEQAINV